MAREPILGMRGRLLSGTLVLGLLPFLASGGEATTYAFTLIADTSGVFESFQPGDPIEATFGPSMNDVGVVAFWASLRAGGHGIFVGSGGGDLTTIADTVSGPFGGISCCPAINAVGTVAFLGQLDNSIAGVFAGSGGPVTTIADSSGSLNGFLQPSINNGGTVAFRAFIGPGDLGGVWIFKGDGGPLTPIASNRSGLFYELGALPAINSAGAVAFEAGLLLNGRPSGGPGLFVGSGGSLTTIATTDLFTAGSPFRGFNVFPAINDAGTVAFEASVEGDGVTGIFTGNGGPVTLVADSTGPLGFLARAAINEAGAVAFLATLDGGGSGIFTGPDPVSDRVIGTGDTLFGATVTNLGFFRDGLNNAGQIAFFARLSDGTVGIYRADPFLAVEIDIKPGSFPNSINLGSMGSVPVAILSSATFDANRVDPMRVTLASGGVGLKGNGTPMAALQDVNSDGLLDLVVHVSTDALELSETDTEAILEGQTFDGASIRGKDSVRIVP